MPAPTKEEVREFIRVNESFFTTPIKDQKKFQRVYNEIGATEDIRQYSQELTSLLYRCTQRLNKESVTPVVYAWRKGNFEPALEHEAVRQFLIDKKDHPAITKWKKGLLLEESEFNKNLQRLQEKATGLQSRKYPNEAKDAQDLYDTLATQKKRFYSGEIKKDVFVRNCNDAIEIAQKSTLKNHRGFLGNIWHGLKVALNFITRGYVEVTPTDSIKKTQELKDSLKSITEAGQDNINGTLKL
ncbi:Uncharacterised protein [Legionella lansingensis]|uniref:Uncharacterized protein n=1 Tax=Legionella lansingensis TaxID=45067 RepID=A0A0W0VUF5_9GAMM|nr:hypothetical protein [Legionella lansingensis]KTD23787.1 hypothetical protein Llan_0568 [Legionella lansingensis]SNV47280.1 Uncharacterised protein [Legionella lansingensis]